MVQDLSPVVAIDRLLEPFGLYLIGSLQISPQDQVPDVADKQPARQLLLIGNGGSSLWPAFSHSPEFQDGIADPLDRWSARVGDQIAAKLGGMAIFPFDGPPYAPFLSWASKARHGKTGQVLPSRLSMSIHSRFGLWHAYRFALALPELQPELQNDLAVESEFKSPCLSCEDEPCLRACPVGAFTGESYRVDQCMDYLVSDTQSACRELGCEARRACPVGNDFTYLPQHAKFHMDAFVASRGLSMIKITTIFWRDIPAQVIGQQGRMRFKQELEQRFAVAIDRAAMRAGRGSSDAYLEDWRRVKKNLEGDLETLVREEVATLEAEFNEDALEKLTKASGVIDPKD